MRAPITSSTISCFAVAVAAVWMCGAGPAWAGGGGESLTTLQAVIGKPDGSTGFCNMLGMGTNFGTTCPQLRTFTQAILEAAGLANSPPEMVAAQNGLPPGNNVYATNPAAVPTAIPVDSNTGLATLPLATTTPNTSDVLATLTPLAFEAPNASGPTVTQSTNGATTAGNSTLNFAKTNGLITGQNYSIADTTTPTAIPTGTTLISFTGTTVTMSANAVGPGVKSGDKITFTPIATAVQLYDPNAGAFLYAMTVSSISFATPPGGTVPDTLYVLYEDLSRNNQTFNNGQTVAKFSLPLTVLNSDGTENPQLVVILQINAICNGGPACLKAQAVGGIGTPQSPVDASQLGIQFALVFSASPTSSQNHAIFELAVPLLVTGASPPPFNTDPAYFYSSLNKDPVTHQALAGPINLALFSAFLFDDLGTPLTSSANFPSIGLAPTAGPLCTPTTCPTPPTTPPPGTYALCASLPDNSAKIWPSIGAYYGISTAGATLLSAALPSRPVPSTSVCPF